MNNDDANIIVGQNLARLRENRNLSLEDVARLMRQQGYKWKKDTVYTIEQGRRALKIAEAHDLLGCLGEDPTDIGSLFRRNNEHILSLKINQLDSLSRNIQRELEQFEQQKQVIGLTIYADTSNGYLSDVLAKHYADRFTGILDDMTQTLKKHIPESKE
ncbi:helix-turn-helix domain-containing protein [Bifidobacterium primatium]|nr:helix-turn-helix transcriptional regulator [Bifidobacterium primatium]